MRVASKLDFESRVEAIERRSQRWTRQTVLADSLAFRIDDKRIDEIINVALEVEVALGKERALLEHDFDRFDLDDLDAMKEYCVRYDRRPVVVRRVSRGREYLDLARSDL
ncbi:MAG: hypothetical protein ACREJX_22185, partial [Polyangiaceae bacterium]